MPPPRSLATAPTTPEIDHKHSATIKADRSIIVPNIHLIIQRDLVNSETTGLTLLSIRPGADGSRILFGTTLDLASLDKLPSADIRFAGARFLDTHGNGVFTGFVCYQPKFATLKITRMTASDAEGTLSGEFYRFKAGTPTARPDVVELEATFVAVLTTM